MDTQFKIERRDFVLTSLAGGVASLGFPAAVAKAEIVKDLYENIPIEDEIMGNADASVTLLEYASMTCPHCKSFHEQIMPEIKKRYIDTGKVKYIVRPFPFNGDRRGEAAFQLAKCAPDNKYYPVLDELFTTQSIWARNGNPIPEMMRVANLFGISATKFNSCISDGELLSKIIEGRNLAIQKFKVTATPTVFIDNERYTQPNTVNNLSSALDKALGS